MNKYTSGLNLTSRVLEKKPDEKFIYDLVAVSNHMGYLGGGHYTAFALNAHTNRWYFFDDSSTRECDPSKIVVSCMCFFKVFVSINFCCCYY